MLILTRRIGESLMIGDEVQVSVLAVKGNQIRLGVKAPRSVAVHREEIFERIQEDARKRAIGRRKAPHAQTTATLEEVEA